MAAKNSPKIKTSEKKSVNDTKGITKKTDDISKLSSPGQASKASSGITHSEINPVSLKEKEQKDAKGSATADESQNGLVKLPNQPLTPLARHTSVISTEMPKKPEVCTAAVKWKSKLSVLDGIRSSLVEETNGTFSYEKLPSPRETKDETDKPKLSANGKSVSLDIPEQRDEGNGEVDGMISDVTPRRESFQIQDREVNVSVFAPRSERIVNEVPRSQQLEAKTLDNSLLAAVPYMPRIMAYTCLIFNVILPGTGTIMAGASMICCGKPRGHIKPDQIFSLFSTNLFVGIAQLFTVSFLLVGWIWSITWGIYMVLFAEAYIMKQEEEKRYRQTVAVANALWRK